MSARVLDTLLPRLRHEPTRKRVRAELGGEVVVDSTEAVMVWEPHRVIPAYAVPREHVRGELPPAPAGAEPAEPLGFRLADGTTVLDPSVPFAVHSTDGEPLSLSAAGQTREGVAFRPADPDLAGHVVLDFDGFDAWYEEDEQIVVHPRDPFHRLDILPSSRHVHVELDGVVLAESARARLLFDGPILPVRAYLPPDDIRVRLRPSRTRTRCPHKGEATYWSVDLDGYIVHDLAWSYENPLPEAALLAGLVCFFSERADLIFDGRPEPRPHTPWARASRPSRP
jgi:uncharacterized protein (DUF427 family)